LLGAVFSLVIIGVMAGATIICANHACLADPNPSRAVLDLDIQPTPAGPMTLGRLPTANPPG
jgi:hypothetical protein